MAGVRVLKTKLADTTIEAATGYVFDIQDMGGMEVQVDATVVSAAKTAACAVAATLTTQTNLVLTAVVNNGLGSLGNNITIAFTGGATAGAEVVTVIGNAISVQVQTGVSTVTQVRTAMQAAAACTALVTTTGTNASTIVIAAAVPLASGADSKFSVADDTITIATHGFYTGLVVQATKSGAAFPTGIAASTNYYVVKIDANTIKLASTLALANALTPDIDITADGTLSSTITLTPTAVSACSYKLQKSSSWDPITSTGNFIDLVAGETNSVVTNTISATSNTSASGKQIYAAYGKILFAISAGTVQVKIYAVAKAL